MGRPLRKLHQDHSKAPHAAGYARYVQYPHHDPVPALKSPPKRMEAQGFVPKNQRLEKVHRES
jgi:hypothetical protein